MSGSFSRPQSSAQPVGVVENPVFSPPIQSDATTSSTVSMPFVRRHVTRRLKAAKADCDRELRQVIYSITSLFEERCEGEQNGDIDHHDRDKDVDRGSQHSDFDDVRELFAVTRPASPADDSAYDVKCDYRHSRQCASPNVSRSVSSLRVPSGSSTAKDSTSESPSLFPPTTNRGSAATSTSVNRTSSPILINDPTDPLIFALYGLIGIATDVTEMSIAQLEAQPNICVPLVRRVQDIGNTWDHYPDLPGRSWYVQALLAIASLSRVVEWWEAEKLFWGFGNAYDEAIEHTRALLESMPMGDPRRRPTLLELSSRLSERFKKEGDMTDLTEVTIIQRAVLEITPLEYPNRFTILSDLADCLSDRLRREDDKVDLNEIITLRRAALESIAQDDPGWQPILAKLDDCLYERFRRKGAMADLEEVITLRRATLERTPLQDQSRPLLSLADCLCEKFQKLGLVADIEEAVKLGRAAFTLCAPGHPDRPLSQDRLTNYLGVKVRKRGTRVPAKMTGAMSCHIKQLIRSIVFETFDNIPTRLLYTETGTVCNRDAQPSHFEASPQYSRLLSLASASDGELGEAEIRKEVSEYFQYATLSHRWGSGEPLLRDVEGTSVYDLDGTDGLGKVQEFCIHAFGRGFLWAWSDTCCIDKDSSAELQEAIGSMFSWYRWSSLTLVHLSDVSEAGSLADSMWFKRGWTLQELLASPIVLFYMQDWSLFMNHDVANHKTDPAVLAELQKATGIAEQHLTNFYPGMDDARSRLQWASGRRTTRPEDIAYSLFGIFKVHLPVLYGESAENALGRLLAEIISQSGDVSVLDWVGEASAFHSCFPARLAPYKTVPHIPLIPSDTDKYKDAELEKALKLYETLAKLPRAQFLNRRLTLPSIAHWVTAVKLLRCSTSPPRRVYEIHASQLQPLEVALSVNLEKTSNPYVLIRPWHLKSLEAQVVSGNNTLCKKMSEHLEKPFSALLLRRLAHNEYKRVASDCAIVARIRDLDSVLDSEVLIPEIV